MLLWDFSFGFWRGVATRAGRILGVIAVFALPTSGYADPWATIENAQMFIYHLSLPTLTIDHNWSP